ncbi:MAG: valine--tRNA ligase [bacterium]|nr:valine--tRNA ligase [bacterium]
MSTQKNSEKQQELPPQYDPKATEDKIYRLWEESGFFNPDKLPSPSAGQIDNRKKAFTIVVPPPNVTGSLHLGHALNAAIQDILIRKKRMEGYKTLWLPGTDHAGIATQNVVEKELKKEGKNRHDLVREKFIERVWEWKEKYGNIILEQFKKLGSSMDWSRTRFTMDEGYRKAVEAAFLHYYEKGWIYRAERVINWCPKDQTSLSDLEIEYKEEEATLYYIRYPLILQENKEAIVKLREKWPLIKSVTGGLYEFDPNKFKAITVATTRPETMLGDTAVAVNINDERFKKYVGEKVLLPIQNREIPIVADDSVEKEFGTGAVKVTPSHDLLDADIAERHNLPRHTVINKYGKMTKKAGVICEGLKASECRGKVVEELKKAGLLEKEEKYTHNVAVCYRCGATIEPIPSLQWFLKMGELAKLAMGAVENGKVKFHPERWNESYLEWLRHVRDWTISRQIWWGHRIPVWFHEPKCEPRKDHEADVAKCFEFIVSAEEPKCEFCNAKFVQDLDVLDTWFSSALWPFATLGWPDKTEDLNMFYPTDVLSTARDIINLWVSRMIFSGMEFMKEPPFKDVIIHATILTKDGKRMSKSLGTGIDPMTLIEKYGADATRFGIIWQAMGTQDIRWSEEHVLAGKKFANKLWNITRFVITKTGGKVGAGSVAPSGDDKESHELLERLKETFNSANEDIEKFDFGQALHTIYEFAWHDFADKYIEYSKTKEDDGVKETLAYTLEILLKLLHPFMPFVTEEIWSHLPIKNKKLLMVEEWPVIK